MSDRMVPYLRYFRDVFDHLEDMCGEPAQARIAIARRLLDSLIARSEALPGIRAALQSDLRARADNVHSDSDQPALYDAAQKLTRLLEKSALDGDFRTFEAGLGDLQNRLIASGHQEHLHVAESIIHLEQRYYSAFKSAVATEHAARASTSGARGQGANDAEQFDLIALTAFLREALDEATLSIVTSRFLAGGFSKITLGVKLAGVKNCTDEIVLRCDSAAIHSAGSVISEYELLRLLYEDGVCAPQPLAAEPSGKVFGKPFIVVARRPGISIGGLLRPPARNPLVARDVARHLARLHNVPLERVRGVLPAATISATEWVTSLLNEDYRNWKALNIPSSIFEAAFAWLRKNVHLNDNAPRVLTHGDFGMHNMLVHKNKISAILDWEFACVGHAAYDLAYFFNQAESMWSWNDFLQAYADGGAQLPGRSQLNFNILLAATHLGVMSVRLQKHIESGGAINEASASVLGDVLVEEYCERTARALANALGTPH